MSNNQNNHQTRYDMTTPHLQISRAEMPQAWRAVHDDLKKRGFKIAADNMREIIRMNTPKNYWAVTRNLTVVQ